MTKASETVNRFQAQGKTKLIHGSILNPETAGLRFVLNMANMAGKTEGGLYPIFDKKWVKVKQEVRGWYVTKTGAYKLGAVNSLATQSDVWVVSCLCQDENLKVDVVALEKCLKEVCKMAKYEHASLHVSTLLTDSVPELSELCKTQLVEQGVSVYFYEEK